MNAPGVGHALDVKAAPRIDVFGVPSTRVGASVQDVVKLGSVTMIGTNADVNTIIVWSLSW